MAYDAKPSFFFVATLMNFVLATGVFTLPFSLYESGIILGSIILVITCGLSIIACTFIIEALAIQNAFLKEEMLVLDKANDQRRNTTISENSYEFNKSHSVTEFHKNFVKTQQVEQEKVLSTIEDYQNDQNKVSIPFNKEILIEDIEEDDQFYIFKRIEISKMANKVFTKPMYYFIVIAMICYLYIGLTSNAMIAGKSLKSIISKTIGSELPYSYYYLIVIIFYAMVVLIALNNINHLKKFSMFVMICRFLMIFLILGSCIYSIIHFGGAKLSDIPKFNMPNITVIIGNSLFLFMSHHSMPGMVENFKPQKNLIKLVTTAYIMSLLLMLAYGYVSLFAFAHIQTCSVDDFPCAIQSTFSLNFISFNFIGYVINYYPLLNIITSAMLAITLKNNILQVIESCSLNLYKTFNFSDKTGLKSTIFSLLFNIILVLPSVIAAIFLPDIQQLMKYFSSIFGFIIMIIVPLSLIYASRKKLSKFNLKMGKLNRAFLNKNWQLVVMSSLGIILFTMIIYGFFNSINKTCVAEKAQIIL